ncbi:MAG: gluconate 2-dehydrogenase subunit 3 family protein [Bryobacteraceae bacterium]
MPSRRDALRLFAASAAFPVLPWAQSEEPKFFSKDELSILAVLCDLIVPRTDTPGAADAGAHWIIDEDMAEDPAAGKILRDGIATLGGTKFLQRSAAEQNTALAGITETEFFKTLKRQTIDAYYHTQEGLVQELGYHGNVALPSFPGCTHPEHQRLD